MNNINIKKVLDDQEIAFKPWLKSSAVSWKERGDINAFFPLELMFPVDEDEWVVLAEAIENLQETKEPDAHYSDMESYELDIISLIGDNRFCEEHQAAWEFVLKIATELQIVEVIPILLQCVRVQRLRLFEAFDIADRYSETSPEVRHFYENSISQIDEMPSYALRLLKKLIKITPEKASSYIRESKIVTAINQYRYSIQNRVTPVFEEAAKEIGEILNDEQYQHFVESANQVGLNTLVSPSRLSKIVFEGITVSYGKGMKVTPTRKMVQDKTRKRSSIQPPYVEGAA